MPRQQVPIQVAGSSTFGIWPKISLEKTYNMFISDGWLINYPGYKRVISAIDGREGRGIFHSTRGNFILAVVDSTVYRINKGLGVKQVGTIRTSRGEVFMDENLLSQICIVDGNDAYIYFYDNANDTDSLTPQTLSVTVIAENYDVIPGYVAYHNTFFLIAPAISDPNSTNRWYVFQRNTDTTITHVATGGTFQIQTKPGVCLAIQRLPGRGNHVLVIGETVCEVFTQVGGTENYRRNSSFNIDYGCISRSTISSNDQFVSFVAANENNSPALLVTTGSEVRFISTDGIDHLFRNIQFPEDSTAFFYKVSGHLFYQVTFFNPEDNLSLIYDFTADKFYHVTDDFMNFHPARQVVYFDNKNYFISLKTGGLYESSLDILDAIETIGASSGRTIPRIRVANTIRLPTSDRFFCNNFTFWLEQGDNNFFLDDAGSTSCVGQLVTEVAGDPIVTESGDIMLAEWGACSTDNNRPRVDLSFSKNGNQSFSNIVGKHLNAEGVYRNKIQWHKLGVANEMTLQLRFWGMQRFVANNGVLEIIDGNS